MKLLSDAKAPVLKWIEVVKALTKKGFKPIRQPGSHVILVGPGGKFTVVPRHDEIAPTTLMKILACAEISKEEFLELLR